MAQCLSHNCRLAPELTDQRLCDLAVHNWQHFHPTWLRFGSLGTFAPNQSLSTWLAFGSQLEHLRPATGKSLTLGDMAAFGSQLATLRLG
ncbi:hypothetical protein AVEN_56824-1 [Araneus ventricosus]|uniref:Uncharacterized protein n=1 Tax=Araneus ventricosus TaxID=182803 RepID=A0A4Y2VCY3_ARAVE|nr:hypothetical protein AVEN_56824-1 [Araneus ventricosus]